jgi:enoyl-CoA hydratase/carnithine racemase
MSQGIVTCNQTAQGVVVVTMAHRPANALGPPLLNALDAAITAAQDAGDVKVMIVRSALDNVFAAGADIKYMNTVDAATFLAYIDTTHTVLDRLAGAPWLSIAAIDGLAIGGGLELSLACTMRVSGGHAKLALPEVKLGLIPGAGGTQRLPRLVGRGRALDIILTGRQIRAEEAEDIGLVDRVTNDDVTEAALELAGELITASLPAQLAAVRAVDAAFELPLAEGIACEKREEQGLFEYGEAAEGIAAFVAKRAPKFA